MPRPGERFDLADLGLGGRVLSRRAAMKAGIGAAAGAGLAAAGLGAATAPAHAGLNKLATANAVRVGGSVERSRITGPTLTDQWGSPYTDLCIPVTIPGTSSLLLIGGDTYGTNGEPADPSNDWRSPVGLTSSLRNGDGRIVVNGAIQDRPGHAKALVIQNHDPAAGNYNTELPTDVFAVGNTLYMHTCFGVYGRGPNYSAFYNSTDGGRTWNYLRRWDNPGDYGGQFQQKTYAVANDDYVYVMSTAFRREAYSGLLLFRVRKSDLNKTDRDAGASGFGQRYAYEGWGYANGRWAWGNLPTTIIEVRQWGEICFRAMGGKYVLSWFQRNEPNINLEDCRAMVFALPTSNLVQTTEQTMVYHSPSNPSSGGFRSPSVQPFPYAPFVIPGSTFANFNFVVSNWDQNDDYDFQDFNYGVSQWKTSLNPNI